MRADRRLVRAVARATVDRPGAVVVGFLLLTGVFAVGLGNVSTEAGTSQFTEDLPAQRAFEAVNEKFTPTFAPDTGSTQLVQSSRNVLSKPSLLRLLEAQKRLAERPSLRVVSTTSAASVVATTLDPTAEDLDAQIRAVERATPGEIDAAVRDAAASEGFANQLSDDFNRPGARASATVAVVEHELPAGLSATAGAGTDSPLTSIQVRAQRVVASAGGDITVFGAGLVAAEFANVVFDSLILVLPASITLIFAFLLVAYRDPVDLVLGLVALAVALVWTFGFLGLVGIPFSQLLIAVPPLLLAVGIDFGIHSVNRYREERVEGNAIEPSMAVASRQLLVAFFIVTATTALGFAANLTSGLAPIREFGLVAAVGITFTFLIFGVFLPASKVLADRFRERRNLPTFGERPLGAEGSLLGSVSAGGLVAARKAPRLFVAFAVLLAALSGFYGLGVDTEFSQNDFLPPEETPDYLDDLPEPFRPSEYTVTGTLNFLEANFERSQGDSVTVYVEGILRRDYALESFERAASDPPAVVVSANRTATTQSILDVIRDRAAQSASFRRLVERNDANDDGVPDDNLDTIYSALLDSPARDRALRFVTDDRRAARVVYTLEADATQAEVSRAGRELADRHRFEATATGETVVFQAVSDVILASAVTSLAVALAATAVFLVAVYAALEGRPSLGVVNLVPIVLTIAYLAGSMRAFGLPFNALTATILSITIGLGTDYSAHVVHRFADEYGPDETVYDALDDAVRGTGSALAGSMLTTTSGIGVLVFAITPVLGQFGVLTALSIFYSYLTAVFLTPSVLVLWGRVA
ncbi:efflux RND transporter permease subunit [Halobacterium litoreum]|uniref:RND family transporter n=1 Tax=Halobacterium litoreum TaxID=2039234 RepID=A0ABD5NE66_9EURY|nr:MMPL family transporter [Halobacterium litoreum]UHH13691.1 MMPL family transporter [Halobacterium litoreum]